MPVSKPGVFVASNVFREIAAHPKVPGPVREAIARAWANLEAAACVQVFDGRFPSGELLARKIADPSVRFVGCHLSHHIPEKVLAASNVVAVCTATAGFDHVETCDGVLVTHTPGVLHRAVADYTVALALATLRNVVDLHGRVWTGAWTAGDQWDLDADMSRSLDGQVVGLVGLGEIGKEVARRLAPWGVRVLYHDVARQEAFERDAGVIHATMQEIFEEADVISLHLPLVPATRHVIGKDLLSRVKDGALLVNTARGGVLDTGALLHLLESGEKAINVALDVHEQEPLDAATLARFVAIKASRPDLRFTLMPHNASSDAGTRGTMAVMMLEDLHRLVTSRRPEDLEPCRLIPAHRQALFTDGKVASFRIHHYWEEN